VPSFPQTPPTLARVLSAAVNGIEAFPVEVEVNSGWGDTIVAVDGSISPTHILNPPARDSSSSPSLLVVAPPLFSIFAMLLLLTGCKGQIKTTDIAGRYLPSDSTKTILAKMGYSTNRMPVLELGSDSALLVTNVPDIWLEISLMASFGHRVKDPGYHYGHGKWRLPPEQSDLSWHIDFEFDELYLAKGTTITNKGRYGVYNNVEFSKRGNRFVLRLIVGDPDSGDVLEFKQSPPTTDIQEH
jgi:hypothetical protein